MMGVNWRVDLHSGAIASPARALSFSLSDPRGDQTGRIDVTALDMRFNDSTGAYEIILTADHARPFVGAFRVNINLFNPDVLSVTNVASFFSHTSPNYNLPAPATTLRLTGIHPHLATWKLGHRVAAGSVPFGNPPMTTLFRSAVLDQPQQNCAFDPVVNGCLEDTIAWGASTTLTDAPPINRVTALSSASYLPGGAPESLVSLFGSGLARAAAAATLGADGQWPTTIADVSVEINGRAAPLAYVSPTQINLVVPRETELGEAVISVKNAGAEVASGTLSVSLSSPALFSSDGNGKGAAVAFNAVTFTAAPFTATTPENSGTDKRTRLAILGTGIRYAGNNARNPAISNAASNVRMTAVNAAGRAVTLPIEYAGPAPGFPGVDQVNVILPGEAGSADRIDFTVQIAGVSSNTVVIPIRRDTPAPSGLEVSPAEGFSATGPEASFTGGQNRMTYTLRNLGSTAQTYTARPNVPWLSVTPASGTLAASATSSVTVDINSNAGTLSPGTYTGVITFTGATAIVTRTATLVVTSIGSCVDIGGEWNGVESGSFTLSITALGDTETDRIPISGQGRVNIVQDGCSVRYTPTPISGLFTQQEAESLQRSGSVNGVNVSVQGPTVLVVRPMPGFNITRVDENQLQASGRLVAGVLTLTSNGRYRASGNFSVEGQSGTFTVTITASATATLRRP
jgi:uncharacterized protein (TIGR03437 family)